MNLYVFLSTCHFLTLNQQCNISRNENAGEEGEKKLPSLADSSFLLIIIVKRLKQIDSIKNYLRLLNKIA